MAGTVVKLKPLHCSARARHVLEYAAALLDGEADALKECSTVDGDWREEDDAKASYEDMKRTAQELRALCCDRHT